MKQYTTPEQTAKLIELGFDRPKFEIETQLCNIKGQPLRYATIVGDYSIGELIEMLPLSVDSGSTIVDKDYYMLTIRGYRVMYCDPYIDFILLEFSDNAELVDNLFDMVVFLKAEGVI